MLDTQSADVMLKQNAHDKYIIMKTMYRPGYHHSGFGATLASGQMMYTLLEPVNQECSTDEARRVI